jgi:polysaccharide export outer membrane protein
MGQPVSLFLMRAAAIVLAGMLLFAVFGHAHAQGTVDYGLKRFPGDNYDTLPPGDGIAPVPAPQGYAPVAGSSVGSNGYYSTLSANPTQAQPQPQYPQAQGYQAQPQGYQQPVAQMQPAPGFQAAQPMAYGYKPLPGGGPETVDAYGYKPSGPSAPGTPQTQVASNGYYQQASYQMPGYVLGTGDKLHLTVYGETDLSGDFAIDGAGFVRLPLIGQVRASGYTATQLEAAVGSALAQGYLKSPRVSVEVSAYRPFYIIGAVNRPGQYPYEDHMNAMNAVALAGGFTSGAVESVVFVRREGTNQEVELPVDRTTEIYPGDVVRVHTTFFTDAVNILSPFSGVAASAATAAVIQ